MQKALRERFTGAKPADVVQGSLEILREVSTILAAKALHSRGDKPGSQHLIISEPSFCAILDFCTWNVPSLTELTESDGGLRSP